MAEVPPPFWVVGAPRSGTTFFGRVLDRHPGIFCTEETRVMTFVNRILNGLASDTWILMNERARFLALLKRELPRLVREFYEELGADGMQRWGDKHPHYADPYHDPDLLDLIEQLFPESQYIHIIRDGRAVVASNMAKGWGTIDYACDSWRRHVVHARDFGSVLGPKRYLEVRYEDLVNEPAPMVAAIFEFLGVGDSPEVDAMLAAQGEARTPYSAPTDPSGIAAQSWRERYDAETLELVERRLADMLVELGYEDPTWRRQVLGRPTPRTEPWPPWTPAGQARIETRAIDSHGGTRRGNGKLRRSSLTL